MNEAQSTVERRLRMALVIVGILGMIAILLLEGYGAGYQGFAYRCMVEGPFPTSPPLALVSESGPERAYLSFWPFGRACDWERADGQGIVTAFSSWSATGAFLVCAAMAIGGGFLLGRRRKARSAATVD